jgi:diguanylate cyclase (GGDEF)-like protein/PAS domain S-box-containing protein
MIQRIRTWLASSIANRIGVSSLVLTLSVALLFGGASLIYTLQLTHDASQRELAHDGSSIAQSIIAKLESIDNDLDILASNPVLLSGALDSSREQVYLKPIIESFQPDARRPRMLCITDYRGKSLACTGSASETWQHTADAEAAIASGRVSASFHAAEKGQSGKLHIITPLVYYQTGQAEGALVAEYDLDELIHDAAGGVGNVVHLNLKDRSGTDLFFKGSRSNIVQYNQTLAPRPPFDKLGLSITVGADRSRIQEPLWRIGLIFLLLTLLFVPLIVLAARRLSLSVTHNLALLTEAAEQSTLTGHLPLNMPGAGADEVGRLSQAFAQMVRRVQETLDGLEHAVAERTGELAGSEQRLRTLAEDLRRSERFLGATLDGLSVHIAVLDDQGLIILTNKGYRDFGEQNGVEPRTVSEGANYLAVCDRASGEHSTEATPFANGIREVLSGKRHFFELEYPCHSPDMERWFVARATPFIDEGPRRVIIAHENITERKQAEAGLQASENRFRNLLENIPTVAVQGYDENGITRYWNNASERLYGYSADEAIGRSLFDLIIPAEMHDGVREAMRVMFETAVPIPAGELPLRRKDGSRADVFSSHAYVQVPGRSPELFCLDVDISEQRRAQQALEIERTHLHTLVRTIPDLIWLKDVDGIYLACNPEFERFFGAAERDILGKTDYDFVSKDLADFFRNHDRASMAAGEATRNEEWITYASDGRRVLLETTKTPMRTPEGRLVGILGVGHDITERDSHQQQLEHIAHFDNLTGLPNRVLLADRLHQAMTQTLRRKTMLAVTFLDLDGFKAINDNYGHEAGDYLLTTLSGHMKRALREGDTLARIGGDEFVAILLDLPDIESSVPMISRLLAAAAEVSDFKGNTLRVSASLGATFYPQAEAIDADQLMRQADQAMYTAKQSGKNRYHIFDTEHDRSVRSHHESLDRIKQALDQREFVLYYQPKVNMRTGVVIGTEALIRWQRPEQGLLAPAAFLPFIADHPLAIEIGEWVLDTAMAQIETWKAAGLPLLVSVNIDAIHLEQTDFVDHLRQQLLAHPALSAGDLELEVLETSALHDIAYVSSVILACREMGVGFALDDFGTGYSSLTYLKHLPASLLKIDQSFVRDMLDDPDDLSILNGVLGLSIAFRRQAIAEGVETLEHGEILLQLGCELAQGYAIARPMPAEDIPVWLAAWRPDPSWLNRAPISRDDLPILIAWVEHRAWILKVGKFIRGVGDTLPPLNHEQCRVGQWLKDEVRLPKENHLAIEALGPLHIEIHELASELIRLKQDGQMEVAIARLPELYRLRDRLLAKFMAILR